MKKIIKVYLYVDHSCETVNGRWIGLRLLRELYELSNKKYLLINDPEAADIILFGDVMENNWTKKILGNKLIKKYSHKSFSVSWNDRPFFLNHGIYTSNKKCILTHGRVRTGAYTAHGDKYRNPFIESHRNSIQDYIGKEYLFSFIGRKSHEIRRKIFNLQIGRQDIFIEDSSTFKLWDGSDDEKIERQKYYYEKLLRSKFSLCPRGSGPNSIRLFESMQLGVAPVIISDDWVFPRGPKWREFAIIIKEKDIRDLTKIVQYHEDSYKEMGQSARMAYDEYFSEDVYFNYLISNCIDIINNQLLPESIHLVFTSILLKSKINISMVRAQIRLRSRLKEFGKKKIDWIKSFIVTK